MEEMEENGMMALWGNRHKYCPEKMDRNPLKRSWTCDQYFEFNNIEIVFQISGIVCGGYEILMALTVSAILVSRMYA